MNMREVSYGNSGEENNLTRISFSSLGFSRECQVPGRGGGLYTSETTCGGRFASCGQPI